MRVPWRNDRPTRPKMRLPRFHVNTPIGVFPRCMTCLEDGPTQEPGLCRHRAHSRGIGQYEHPTQGAGDP